MTKAFAARIPLNQKFMLTIKEASLYFNISEKKLRGLVVERPEAEFFVFNGRKYLMIREEFEKFLLQTSCI